MQVIQWSRWGWSFYLRNIPCYCNFQILFTLKLFHPGQVTKIPHASSVVKTNKVTEYWEVIGNIGILGLGHLPDRWWWCLVAKSCLTPGDGEGQGSLVCCSPWGRKSRTQLSNWTCLTPCDPMDYIAYQAPLSMGCPRQEYWSGLPFPFPGYLPDPGIKPSSLALAGGFFTTEPPGKHITP